MTTKISLDNIQLATLEAIASIPKITAIVYPNGASAADPAGGETITITGTGFSAGATVLLDGATVGAVNVASSSSLSFTSPAKAVGSNYVLYIINADGGTAILYPGLSYSGVPTWVTPSGSIGSNYEASAITKSFTATGDGTISYSIASGTLPTGTSFNGTTGVLSGTAPAESGSTTYTFTVRATDAQGQVTDRIFSLTINTDVITWTNPATDNSTYPLFQYESASYPVGATAASGTAITFAANSLPAGLSLNTSSGLISGTPTVLGSNVTLLTANAIVSTRTATRTIIWTVSVAGDTYYNNTVLLLNGEAAGDGAIFVTDASSTANNLTIAGDTRPDPRHPYSEGYYSCYFDGSGDYISIPNNTATNIGTGDFTIELWLWMNTTQVYTNPRMFGNANWNDAVGIDCSVEGGSIQFRSAGGTSKSCTFSTSEYGAWHHIAFSRSNGSFKVFKDGVLQNTYTESSDLTSANPFYVGTSVTNEPMAGYVSNFRLVKGVGLYSTSFTPPTGPLYNINGTGALLCQASSLVDNGPNRFAVTKTGDTKVTTFVPYGQTYTAAPVTSYSTYFDGTGDYLTVSSTANAAFGFGTADFTVEGWFYATRDSSTDFMIDFRGGVATAPAIFVYTSNQLALYYNGSVVYQPSSLTFTVGRWNHVALVRSSAVTKFYLNGIGAATTYADTNNYPNAACIIGSDVAAGGSSYWTGYISNIRIVKGTALFTANFVPSTSSLTAISGTSLLTCQDPIIADRSTNAFAITRNGDAVTTKFHPFSANGYITTTTVPSTYSTYFDGQSTSYLTYASLANAQTAFAMSAAFTIEAWVFPLTTTWMLVTGLNTSSSATWWEVYHTGSGFFLVIGYWGVASATASTSALVPTGTWTHVVMQRRTDNTIDIYYNGVAQTVSNGFYGGFIGANLTPGAIPKLGGGGYNTAGALYVASFRSTASRVYTANFVPSNSPLTAITGTGTLLCQNATVIDNSVNAFTITANGGAKPVTNIVPLHPTTGLDVYYYGSGYFDGTGDYLTASSSANFTLGTGDFTIEAWIYPTNSSGTQGVLACADTGSAGDLTFFYNLTAGKVTLNAYGGTAAASTASVPINAWTHVAFSRASGSLKTFLNGTLDNTTAFTGNFTKTAFVVGRSYSTLNQEYFTGYINDLRLINGTALYATSFAPPVQALTAVTNTRLLTLQNKKAVKNQTVLDVSSLVEPVTVSASAYQSNFSPYAVNWSVYFDGTGDYLNVPTSSLTDISTSACCVEAWVYWTDITTYAGIWCTANGASGQTRPNFVVSSTGAQIDYFGSVFFTAFATFVAGTWYHVAFTRDATNGAWRFFQNGVLRGYNATGTQNLLQTSTAQNIGLYSSTLYFKGYISNVRLTISTVPTAYQTASTTTGTTIFTPSTTQLTPDVGTRLLTCNRRTVHDCSPNYFDITVFADTAAVNFSPFGNFAVTPNSYSVAFDGTSDYLTVPSNAAFAFGTGDFTIEAWIYLTAYNATYGSQIFGGHNYGVAADLVFIVNTTGKLYFQISSSSTGAITSTSSVSLNTWTHVAVVRSSGTVTPYINGTGAGGGASYTTSVASTINPAIGGSTNGNNGASLTGLISNLRVTKGQALYTTTFTPSTTALTTTSQSATVANVSLLTCQSTYLIDNSINAFTITATGDARPREVNPFGWTTAQQKTSYSPSTIGGSFKFSGAQNIAVSGAPTGVIRGDAWTIEWWQYSNTFGGHAVGTHSSGISASVIFAHNSPGQLFAYMNGISGTNTVWANARRAPTKSWHHFAVTKNGTVFTWWYDGGNMGSATCGATESVDGSGYSWRLGSEDRGLSYIDGFIADHRITKGTALYTSAFIPPTAPLTATAKTALLLQANPQMIDYTMNHSILTVGDAKISTAAKKYGSNSYYFDGSGDYLLVTNKPSLAFGTADFTLECWIYATAASDSSIYEGRASGSGTTGFTLTAFSTSVIRVYTGAAALISSTGTTFINIWTHVAVVRSSGTTTLYINGSSVGSSGSMGNLTDTDCVIGGGRYGGTSTVTSSFTGYIDDFRITNGYARYTTTFTPPTSTFYTK